MCIAPYYLHYVLMIFWLIAIVIFGDEYGALILLLGIPSLFNKCQKCANHVFLINDFTSSPIIYKKCYKCGQDLRKCKIEE